MATKEISNLNDISAPVGTDVNIHWIYPDSDQMVRVTWEYFDANGAATVILLHEFGKEAVVQNGFNIRHNTNGYVTITSVTVANSGTYRITVDYSTATVTDDVNVSVYDTTDANVPPGAPSGGETCCSGVSQPFVTHPILYVFVLKYNVSGAKEAFKYVLDKFSKEYKEKIYASGKRIGEQVVAAVIAHTLTGNGKKGEENKDDESKKGEEKKDEKSKKGEEDKDDTMKKEETDPDNSDRAKSASVLTRVFDYFKGDENKDGNSKKDDPTFDAHYSDSSTEEKDKDVKSETGHKDKDDNSKKGDENKDDESKKGEDDQDDKEKDKTEEDPPEVVNPFAD